MGLVRRLCSYDHLLVSQRTINRFPAPILKDSQPSVTPAPGDPTSSPSVLGHQAHTWYTDVCAEKIPIYIKKILFLFPDKKRKRGKSLELLNIQPQGHPADLRPTKITPKPPSLTPKSLLKTGLGGAHRIDQRASESTFLLLG